MKPQSVEHSHKKQGWVSFSTFAFVDQQPRKLNYVENLIPYEGMDDNLKVPWGVYGTTNLNGASYMAASLAQERKKTFITLSLWYYIEGFKQATTTLPQVIQDTNGFLHMSRIGSDLKNVLRADIIDLMKDTHSPAQIEAARKKDWPSLMLDEPATVRRLLTRYPNVKVVVHPVRQMLDLSSEETLLIGSFRLDHNLIKAIEARYYTDTIQVTI